MALGAAASASAASARNSNVGGLEKKVRVLVVDDDLGQRTVLKSLLSKFGYQVDTAEDGVQAVKSAARVAYDVVLMDGFMPNKTGWEATTEIRQQEEARGDRKKLVIIGTRIIVGPFSLYTGQRDLLLLNLLNSRSLLTQVSCKRDLEVSLRSL
jgi:CheY-like chemotaxis protein